MTLLLKNNNEAVIEAVLDNPTTSTRWVSVKLGFTQSFVSETIRRELLHHPIQVFKIFILEMPNNVYVFVSGLLEK